ncbi:hypothetical protein [Cognatishimia sp. MH4019]|uniref:hypothetical protein n=1 Tax=Cognatishimia sp. MH4019 TaxID=2854030 RepID=UPI001CD52E02|nr:hypothetical protein [Cognatishimia sp. MH4019]
MGRAAFISALTTGGFCAAFAYGIQLIAVEFSGLAVLLVSGVSGFLGSLLASILWSKK